MFTGTCSCGSSEFHSSMISFECAQCGEVYRLDDEDDNDLINDLFDEDVDDVSMFDYA